MRRGNDVATVWAISFLFHDKMREVRSNDTYMDEEGAILDARLGHRRRSLV